MDKETHPLKPFIGRGQMGAAEWVFDDDGQRLHMVPEPIHGPEGTGAIGITYWLADPGGNTYGMITIIGPAITAQLPTTWSVRLRTRVMQSALEGFHDYVHGYAGSGS